MLTGSLVSSLQGEPRATHDIDVIAVITPASVEKLIAEFPPPDFYLDREAALIAMRDKTMFNMIDVRRGGKVDFWILSNEPFEQSRFARRRKEKIFGRDTYVSTPEDTILAKLRWIKLLGGSEKHFVDCLRVCEIQHGSLDLPYIRRWVKDLGVSELWERVLHEAEHSD